MSGLVLTFVRDKYASHASTAPLRAGKRKRSIPSWSMYWIDFQIGASPDRCPLYCFWNCRGDEGGLDAEVTGGTGWDGSGAAG